MISLGCSTPPSKLDQTSIEAINATNEAIKTIEQDIPSIYLVKCEYLEQYKNGTAEGIYDTTKRNNEKARQCRIRHNGLVDILNSKNN